MSAGVVIEFLHRVREESVDNRGSLQYLFHDEHTDYLLSKHDLHVLPKVDGQGAI